jgi:hypothetical protein
MVSCRTHRQPIPASTGDSPEKSHANVSASRMSTSRSSRHNSRATPARGPIWARRLGEGALTDLSSCVTATRRWRRVGPRLRAPPTPATEPEESASCRSPRPKRARPRPRPSLLRSSTMAQVATWLHQTMQRRRVARLFDGRRRARLERRPVVRFGTRALLALAEIQPQPPRRFM